MIHLFRHCIGVYTVFGSPACEADKPIPPRQSAPRVWFGVQNHGQTVPTNTQHANTLVQFGVQNHSQSYPGYFGCDLCTPNHTLGDVNIRYVLTATSALSTVFLTFPT